MKTIGYLNIWNPDWALCYRCYPGPPDGFWMGTKKGTLIPPGGPIRFLHCQDCNVRLFDLARAANGFRLSGDGRSIFREGAR